MSKLQLQKKSLKGFPSLLNYFGFVDDEQSVMLNYDGSLMKCVYYQCPDLTSALDIHRHNLAQQFNEVLMKLTTDWSVNFDFVRMPVSGYGLKAHFMHPALQFFEDEREKMFKTPNAFFESIYVLTLTYRPKTIGENAAKKIFVEGENYKDSVLGQSDTIIAEFMGKVSVILNDLRHIGVDVQEMNNAETLRFLQLCIMGVNTGVVPSKETGLLNYVLGAYDFRAGLSPNIDNKDIGVISVIGFPNFSSSSMNEALHSLPFEYRVSNRFIILDKEDARRELKKILVNWHNKQFKLKDIIMQVLSPGSVSKYADSESTNKACDVQDAINEAEEDIVKYGYFTSSIIVFSESKSEKEQKLKYIQNILSKHQLASRIETINAVEAYLGSLPSSLHNIRRPFINTLNLSHYLNLTGVSSGSEFNPNPKFPKKSSPLLKAVGVRGNPVSYSFHNNDVGHHFVIGTTGFGKSVLQSFFATSFLRYPQAQVFTFDSLSAQFAITKAVGGKHYEIMSEDKPLALCPLLNIENDEERIWAGHWVEELVELQGVVLTPTNRGAITDALDALKSDKVKTLSNLYLNIQDRDIRSALEPFVTVKEGTMKHLMDSSTDDLSFNHYQVLDMEKVLKLDKRYAIPLINYFFHRIDQRLDGRPTLIQLGETFQLLNHEVFIRKIDQWLRQLRSKNASVAFETHNLSDIMESEIATTILNLTPTKIYLPNPMASTDIIKAQYHQLDLNEVQVDIIASLTPKKHYYVTSPEGCHVLDFKLSESFLSLMGKNSVQETAVFRQFINKYGDKWVVEWFKSQGLNQSAYDLEILNNKFKKTEV